MASTVWRPVAGVTGKAAEPQYATRPSAQDPFPGVACQT
ncbi:MAG: hypothetical protein ACI9EZ_001145, partial [Halobacteriales archaeon]